MATAKKETKAKKTTKAKATKPKKKATAKKEKKVKNKFAVIELAGTQLKVREGEEYEVKKLSGNKGDKIELENVLMVVEDEDVKIGEPYVDGAKVTLEITSQKKGEKVRVFKYKAKSRYRRTYGHRPAITRVLVKKIS
jgi:large subunit ribosomal protein L21